MNTLELAEEFGAYIPVGENEGLVTFTYIQLEAFAQAVVDDYKATILY